MSSTSFTFVDEDVNGSVSEALCEEVDDDDEELDPGRLSRSISLVVEIVFSDWVRLALAESVASTHVKNCSIKPMNKKHFTRVETTNILTR